MIRTAITVKNPDSHGIATQDDLPSVWEQLNSLNTGDGGPGLVPLELMNDEQKTNLLTCAVNDSKWVAEGKVDPAVQDHESLQDILSECINC